MSSLVPAFPSLNVSRAWPCQAAGTGLAAATCGATPTSLWRRSCPHGHVRDCWLCGPHAEIVTKGLGACAECAARGAAVPARLAAVGPPLHH